MAPGVYSINQLLALRASPLALKPDGLPAIEQWIEYVYADVQGSREKLRIPHSESQQQQQQTSTKHTQPVRQPRQAAAAGDASPMGNFSTGSRPGLMQTRSTANKSGGMYTQ